MTCVGSPLAAAVKVFMGPVLNRGLLRNAAGYLTKGATAVGCFGVGRAEAPVDNSAGAAGVWVRVDDALTPSS